MGAAPVLRAIAVALRAVLPLSLAAAGLGLDDKEEKEIGEQLELAKEATGLVAEAVVAATGRRPADPAELALADGGPLRALHHLLRKRDPSFGGLVRVRGDRNEYLWVHPRFLTHYQTPLPEIPT